MRIVLPPYLHNVLRLIVKGYTHEAIARELVISPATVHTYVKRLKVEYFSDEPELYNPDISSHQALQIIGARFINDIGSNPTNISNLTTEPFTRLRPFNLLELASVTANEIRYERISGNPKHAILLGESATAILKETARDLYGSKFYIPTLEILVRILREMGWAYSETAPKGDIWTNKTSVVKDLYHIAKQCDEEDYYSLANLFLGDAHHIVKQNKTAIRWLRRALGTAKTADNQLIVLRTLGLDYAYTHNEDGFKNAESQIRKIVEKDQKASFEAICNALESISRGQGILRKSEAFNTLEEVKGYYAQIDAGDRGWPLRGTVIVRTELEFLKYFQSRDIGSLDSRGEEAFRIAQTLGYSRNARQIKQLLTEIMN
jgi:Bacterial regulatory proteins, luxR family